MLVNFIRKLENDSLHMISRIITQLFDSLSNTFTSLYGLYICICYQNIIFTLLLVGQTHSKFSWGLVSMTNSLSQKYQRSLLHWFGTTFPQTLTLALYKTPPLPSTNQVYLYFLHIVIEDDQLSMNVFLYRLHHINFYYNEKINFLSSLVQY